MDLRRRGDDAVQIEKSGSEGCPIHAPMLVPQCEGSVFGDTRLGNGVFDVCPGQDVEVTNFARANRLANGYDMTEVDEFFDFARRDYEEAHPTMGTVDVRRVTFALTHGGYDTGDVDAALDRLEDALAARERDERIASVGEARFMEELTGAAQVLQGRLSRPSGERFRRAGESDLSYDIDQVDELCDTLADYFAGGPAMSPDEVRRAAFAPRRGTEGYREADVDAFLDRVVSIMAVVD